ncbi:MULTISPECIES: ACP S-malonyltransferase [Bacillus]|uniref:ACP S-malonyltransferase n=1 Tax=Bacillus TaxID=1386 RepID=UPI0013627DFE|nr:MULTISPECIES: ACP S-malonyltransferase [Bacillus]MBR0019612.1 ACP S-malonyltransferase [Bacillus subtilis]MCL0026270.1 ACP S-malonyltransferase [Bacillus sp. C21]MCL8468091.1 ACP S-malonyltransferase [Bacillus subtilis]MEC3694922.1 ACP S-malonyltransferase [Bacillus subtilis]MED4556739.1 ACP S-malonyltransferase [Bacillus subtilis]
MITYVFPGQGSQQKGMGQGLFEQYQHLTDQADQILGYSIEKLCTEKSYLDVNHTEYTQPALYVVNALSYLKRVEETGRKPDFAAGHSLGEYNALMAAGAFDFETGLRLVKKRGELMGRITGGGMAAVIGLSKEQVTAVLEEHRLYDIDVANENTPRQIVISGPKNEIEKARAVFENTKEVKLFHPLNVSGAFHSRYMNEAKQVFKQYIDSFQFAPLAIPVISNVYAEPYHQDRLKDTLSEQMDNTVKWTDSIRFLMGRGEMEFAEIGPGTVLTGLIHRIKNEAEPLTYIPKKNPAISAHLKEQRNVQAGITAESLGSAEFKQDYHLTYAYLAGGMYRGIASKEMVVKLSRAGMMGFFGTGGLSLKEVEDAIHAIQGELGKGQAYGINLVHNMKHTESEEKMIDLLLRNQVSIVEASAFLSVTLALVRYRAKGVKRNQNGDVICSNRLIAKISRPEVAESFLSPAPENMLQKLLGENKITMNEAELLRCIPMADDICVEADSGGHTDGGVAYSLMPAMTSLRDEMMKKYQYRKKIRVGAAGGIGTPEAAMAAFMLGADFILTGSINQCTVEAATSDKVKDLLQQMNVQDTAYAPAGDMFESGSKVQVLKKGVFFPARANKLYELYQRYGSIRELDAKMLAQLEEKYFKRSIEDIYKDIALHYPAADIEKAEQNPKHKMALIFRWYFRYSSKLAISGSEHSKVDYQIHCGPALGAFNQWVKGSQLENWRNRHVDEIGKKLMTETAVLLHERMQSMYQPSHETDNIKIKV